MIWLRILMICRPFWQLFILFLYSYDVTDFVRVVIAVSGTIYVVTNALLATRFEHEHGMVVRRWALLVEAAVGVLLAIPLIEQWPLGPVSLLLLPSLVTYAWMFERDAWQWSQLVGMTCVYLVCMRMVIVGQSTKADIAITSSILPELILALYGAVGLFGSMLAFLLQLQKMESARLAIAMRRVEEQSKQLSRVNEQINKHAEQMYDLATVEERNRIAGEIHDTVAHRLTALLVQLQAARRVMGANGDVETAIANLEVCEALARESLDEVRYSVRAIRRDPANEGFELLHRLAVHYASLTGMQIEFQIAAGVAQLPAQVVAVAYRVMQEALTNAQRHGRATRVNVDLQREGADLILQIVDNGKGSVTTNKGFGLSSMSDRVRRLGGDIHVTSTPGVGFELRLRLPLWEGVET